MKQPAISRNVLYHTADILNRPQTSSRSFLTNKHCQGNKNNPILYLRLLTNFAERQTDNRILNV